MRSPASNAAARILVGVLPVLLALVAASGRFPAPTHGVIAYVRATPQAAIFLLDPLRGLQARLAPLQFVDAVPTWTGTDLVYLDAFEDRLQVRGAGQDATLPYGTVRGAAVAGSRMAFVVHTRANAYAVRLRDPRTGETVPLEGDPRWDHVYPAWSPDGTQLALMGRPTGARAGGLYLADGTSLRLIRRFGSTNIADPLDWSPDGTHIAYTRNQNGNADLYLLELATGHSTRLTDHPSGDTSPAFSPDGTQIAFVSVRDGGSALFVLTLDTGDVRRVTRPVRGSSTQPDWGAFPPR